GLEALRAHPLVGDARSAGLLGALELVADKARKTRFDPALNVPDKIAAAAYANGVVFRAFGDGVLGFAPALSFTAGEFDLMFERVRKTLDDVLADAGVQRALDAAHAQPA
ncbi:MAG: aminotransferase class III-fold pyridoxal phosphate-dependent enzyme, partial [Burkholderia sp.]|nr:aminotransferase class III-fold pyridoxal phosphate-dependent enzyme [Burkholderia sp.]